jgi:hypothetical protein
MAIQIDNGSIGVGNLWGKVRRRGGMRDSHMQSTSERNLLIWRWNMGET